MTVTVTRPTTTESTLTWTVTALRGPVEDTVNAAIRYIYPIRWQLYTEPVGDEMFIQEPIPFDSLTIAQKFNILNRELIYYVRELASSGYINDMIAATREVAVTEAETNFDIG